MGSQNQTPIEQIYAFVSTFIGYFGLTLIFAGVSVAMLIVMAYSIHLFTEYTRKRCAIIAVGGVMACVLQLVIAILLLVTKANHELAYAVLSPILVISMFTCFLLFPTFIVWYSVAWVKYKMYTSRMNAYELDMFTADTRVQHQAVTNPTVKARLERRVSRSGVWYNKLFDKAYLLGVAPKPNSNQQPMLTSAMVKQTVSEYYHNNGL